MEGARGPSGQSRRSRAVLDSRLGTRNARSGVPTRTGWMTQTGGALPVATSAIKLLGVRRVRHSATAHHRDSSDAATIDAGFADDRTVIAALRTWPLWRDLWQRRAASWPGTSLESLLRSFRSRTLEGRVDLDCGHAMVWPDWHADGDYPYIGHSAWCAHCGAEHHIAGGAPLPHILGDAHSVRS